jgi:hypothetical protein
MGIPQRLLAAHLEAKAQKLCFKKSDSVRGTCEADDKNANACRPSPLQVKSRPHPSLEAQQKCIKELKPPYSPHEGVIKHVLSFLRHDWERAYIDSCIL